MVHPTRSFSPTLIGHPLSVAFTSGFWTLYYLAVHIELRVFDGGLHTAILISSPIRNPFDQPRMKT